MTAPATACSQKALSVSSEAGISVCGGVSRDPFTARKQQALVLLLAQQLADAQIRRGDRAGAERLWQEVAVLEIDPERITALLFCGQDPDDRETLRFEDDRWLAVNARPQQRGWSLRSLHLAPSRRPQRSLIPV
ncbi:MAG: hypothetical protein ACKOCM_02220 [Cyanobacteriota bacterium]